MGTQSRLRLHVCHLFEIVVLFLLIYLFYKPTMHSLRPLTLTLAVIAVTLTLLAHTCQGEIGGDEKEDCKERCDRQTEGCMWYRPPHRRPMSCTSAYRACMNVCNSWPRN